MIKYRQLLLVFSIAVILGETGVFAQQKIKLPEPQKKIGKPLMETLNIRQSSRSFDSAPLPEQELSNILWAGFGINRPESGKRTAPSARNWQETSIYVILQTGAYVYEPKEHALLQVSSEDLRSLAGVQEYVKEAPLDLIFVSDLSKISDASAEDKMLYCGADAAFIAENVYLYCASQNLAVVVRAMIDKEKLGPKLGLGKDMKIILGQTIGNHKK
jgi:nitroreductase